jgi:hypothetical protein
MQIELRPGSGVAAVVLSFSTLLALEKKDIFGWRGEGAVTETELLKP